MSVYQMDMRGSGIYSREESVDSDCECGATTAVRYTDDWGRATEVCDGCFEEVEVDTDEDDPDYLRDLQRDLEDEDRYGEW